MIIDDYSSLISGIERNRARIVEWTRIDFRSRLMSVGCMLHRK